MPEKKGLKEYKMKRDLPTLKSWMEKHDHTGLKYGNRSGKTRNVDANEPYREFYISFESDKGPISQSYPRGEHGDKPDFLVETVVNEIMHKGVKGWQDWFEFTEDGEAK